MKLGFIALSWLEMCPFRPLQGNLFLYIAILIQRGIWLHFSHVVRITVAMFSEDLVFFFLCLYSSSV